MNKPMSEDRLKELEHTARGGVGLEGHGREVQNVWPGGWEALLREACKEIRQREETIKVYKAVMRLAIQDIDAWSSSHGGKVAQRRLRACLEKL